MRTILRSFPRRRDAIIFSWDKAPATRLTAVYVGLGAAIRVWDLADAPQLVVPSNTRSLKSCTAITDAIGRVSRVSPVHTAMRNCTRDGGGPFEVGNQVLISNHCKLLSSKAMVVSVAANVGNNPIG